MSRWSKRKSRRDRQWNDRQTTADQQFDVDYWATKQIFRERKYPRFWISKKDTKLQYCEKLPFRRLTNLLDYEQTSSSLTAVWLIGLLTIGADVFSKYDPTKLCRLSSLNKIMIICFLEFNTTHRKKAVGKKARIKISTVPVQWN